MHILKLFSRWWSGIFFGSVFGACTCEHCMQVCSHVCVCMRPEGHIKCLNHSQSLCHLRQCLSLNLELGFFGLAGCLLGFPGSTCLCMCVLVHRDVPPRQALIWGLWGVTPRSSCLLCWGTSQWAVSLVLLFRSFKVIRLAKWVMEGANQFSQAVLWPPHICHGMHIHTHTHTNK